MPGDWISCGKRATARDGSTDDDTPDSRATLTTFFIAMNATGLLVGLQLTNRLQPLFDEEVGFGVFEIFLLIYLPLRDSPAACAGIQVDDRASRIK